LLRRVTMRTGWDAGNLISATYNCTVGPHSKLLLSVTQNAVITTELM